LQVSLQKKPVTVEVDVVRVELTAQEAKDLWDRWGTQAKKYLLGLGPRTPGELVFAKILTDIGDLVKAGLRGEK